MLYFDYKSIVRSTTNEKINEQRLQYDLKHQELTHNQCKLHNIEECSIS